MKDGVWCDMKDRNIVLMTAYFSLRRLLTFVYIYIYSPAPVVHLVKAVDSQDWQRGLKLADRMHPGLPAHHV